jgi:hypothetical protein
MFDIEYGEISGRRAHDGGEPKLEIHFDDGQVRVLLERFLRDA